MRDIDRRRHEKKLMQKKCAGKIRYPDITSAIGAAVSISHREGSKYRAYQCPYCHSHHIGHQDKKVL